jgi:hypothetical protein
MSTTAPVKVCVLCKQDVTALKRVKDPAGRYYCEPCYAKAQAAKVAPPHQAGPQSNPIPPSAPATLPAPTTVAAAPIDLADDSYNLRTTANQNAAQVPSQNLLGCSACRKLFPENDVLNIDGEFVCKSCNAARSKTLGYAAPATGATSPQASLNAWLRTSIILACTIAGTWLLFLVILMFVPIVDTTGLRFLAALLGSVMLTALACVLCAIFLGGMLVTTRLFGGVEFGALGPVIVKTMILVILTLLLEGATFGSDWGFILFGMRRLVMLILVWAIFKLDYLEAFVLSLVLWLATWMARIAILAGLLALVRR